MAGAALGRARRRRQNGRPSRTYSRVPSSPLRAGKRPRKSWSRREPRQRPGSEAEQRWPIRCFPLGATACFVPAAAAILGPWVGDRADGLGEGGGPGERGRSGLQGPSTAAATAFVSGSDSESPQPGGGSARRGGGRSPGDGLARARQTARPRWGWGVGKVCARWGSPRLRAPPRTCALFKSFDSALLAWRMVIGSLLRSSRPVCLQSRNRTLFFLVGSFSCADTAVYL